MTATSDSLVLPEDWHLHYEYVAGPVTSRFLRGLQQGRIEGVRSPAADIVYVPPRAYCERTFEPIDEWVEVGPGGTIEAATIVGQQFEGYRQVPFALAFVRLDGADTALVNYVEMEIDDIESAAARLAPGTRVRAVFKEEREARITDFAWELD
ncbi:MAG: DNA-binding protein [Solirubrobacterales bacterium]|jgi:uncharacterized OB-fold protein|nr:DNA-binding protein [Solirubrobacterales bacterium]